MFSSGIRSDVLDIAGASSQSGASLQLYEDNYSSAQKYRVTKNSDGRTYTIAPLCSDKVLDVGGGNKNSGAKVWQYMVNNSEAQKWTFISNRDGSYTVVSDLSGKVLDLYGASTSIGLKLQVYDYNGSKAQRFILTWFMIRSRSATEPTVCFIQRQRLCAGCFSSQYEKRSQSADLLQMIQMRRNLTLHILGNGYYKISNAKLQ